MMPEIYSAQNKTVATIKTCADEPIHIPGSVQPHGFVVVLDGVDKTVRLCSQNITQFLGLTLTDYLSRHYQEALPQALHQFVTVQLQEPPGHNATPQPITINGQLLDCFFRPAGAHWMLECISTTGEGYTVYEVMHNTGLLMQSLGRDNSLLRLCQVVAETIAQVTGYHRVMVYRFDEQYNGSVIAEATTDNITDFFLGLHYPHTDIPEQARALYLRNLMRLIADVNCPPVPLVSLDANLAKPEATDLSDCSIRSASPIHLQYLKNMGVRATLTISLIKDGQLWGLISCHHHNPKPVPYSIQTQAFLLSQLLTSQIAVQETAEQYAYNLRLQPHLNYLLSLLSRNENFKELHFSATPQVLQVADATGAVLVGRNKMFVNGTVPAPAHIEPLLQWLGDKKDIFYTHRLSEDFPPAMSYPHLASGLLYVPIITAEKTIALIFFRAGKDKIINWAGEPQSKNSDAAQLTPRTSFAKWQQSVKGESEPWQQPVLDAVTKFVYALQQHLFRMFQREEEMKYRQLNDQLVRANRELENINWISTHDLKEPLRKIQMFASIIERPDNSLNVESVRNSVDRIRTAAGRMQRLIDDLLRYSKMSNPASGYEAVALDQMVQEVIETFKDEVNAGVVRINATPLPVIQGSAFQLRQLFVNLIGNAVKFGKPNQPQQVHISYSNCGKHFTEFEPTAQWHCITVADEGIGFMPEMSERIFNLFQRGHATTTVEGTGVGLSICRKIMENHGGHIEAESKEGLGATFRLYFPLHTT